MFPKSKLRLLLAAASMCLLVPPSAQVRPRSRPPTRGPLSFWAGVVRRLMPNKHYNAKKTSRPVAASPVAVVDPALPRIFRGWHVAPHEFPWMVKIKAVFPADRFGTHPTRSCGGALVSPEWAVTARHCVTWHPLHLRGVDVRRRIGAAKVRVYLGGHDDHGQDHHWVMAAESIGRKDYGRPNCLRRGNRGCAGENSIFGMFAQKDNVFTNDIALLRLVHPVPITSKVQPVRLPPPDADYLFSPAFVSGWGVQSRDGRPSRTLKASEMTIIPAWKSPACRSQDSFGKLCAVTSVRRGARGGSVCPGDSGSPLVVWDELNGGWTLVGILSNGAKSCFSDKPAVYTSVSDYVPWIMDVFASRGPVP